GFHTYLEFTVLEGAPGHGGQAGGRVKAVSFGFDDHDVGICAHIQRAFAVFQQEVLGRAPAQLLDDHGGGNAVLGAACPEGGQQRFQTRTTGGVLEHIVKLLALQAPAYVVGGHEGTFVVGDVG